MRSSLAYALLLLAACGDNLDSPDGGTGGDGGNGTVPSVLASVPAGGAMDVVLNSNASITFSEPMDAASVQTAFTLTAGGVDVPGTMIVTGANAVFWPSARLAINTTFVATVGTGAKSSGNVRLATAHTWSFMTGTLVGPSLAVPLRSASDFVLLAKSGIVNVPTSIIRGDLGVSPVTSTAITGLPLTQDASNMFATSPEVTGRIYAPDFAAPAAVKLTAAISDMETAFIDAASRAPDVTELGAGTLTGNTLVAGVYKWSSAVNVTTNITLTGSATDVWIFQIAQGLTLSDGVRIILAGNASPSNIFWQVSGQLIANPGSHLEGTVLSQTATTLDTGATLNGRLFAQTAVTVRGATITKPD